MRHVPLWRVIEPTMTTRWLRRFAEMVRRVIGVPDYEQYLAHVRRRHPGDVPVSREAFTEAALVRRYARPGGRCC